MTQKDQTLNFDLVGIKKCQQNRYPLLFVDKITDVIPEKKAKGIKCFSYNEWFFPAHFEDEPNVPGFIQVECLVQTFIMTFLSKKEYRGMKTNFLNIDKVRFKRKIVPGETLNIEAELDSFKRGIAKGFAKSYVNNELACSGEFIVSLPEVLNSFSPSKKTI
tara:strand:- start:20918 stop:21403 length:486 start_codon:yes stop_codon:yes gene_type:complete